MWQYPIIKTISILIGAVSCVVFLILCCILNPLESSFIPRLFLKPIPLISISILSFFNSTSILLPLSMILYSFVDVAIEFSVVIGAFLFASGHVIFSFCLFFSCRTKRIFLGVVVGIIFTLIFVLEAGMIEISSAVDGGNLALVSICNQICEPNHLILIPFYGLFLSTIGSSSVMFLYSLDSIIFGVVGSLLFVISDALIVFSSYCHKISEPLRILVVMTSYWSGCSLMATGAMLSE